METSSVSTCVYTVASWLGKKGVGYVLRTKEDRYFQQLGQEYQFLSTLGLAPGKAFDLSGINFTKQKGFGSLNLTGYWSIKSAGKGVDEGWVSNISPALALIRTPERGGNSRLVL